MEWMMCGTACGTGVANYGFGGPAKIGVRFIDLGPSER